MTGIKRDSLQENLSSGYPTRIHKEASYSSKARKRFETKTDIEIRDITFIIPPANIV